MLALDTVARIATGMGKPFEKQTRFFVLPVCTVLSDQKAPIRAAGIQTLTAIATACEGLEGLTHGLTAALEVNQPLQRAQLFGWIIDWLKEHEMTPGLDLSSWVPPIVGCLDDRNGDVRKGAQALLPYLIASIGFDQVMHQTNSLKPASKSSAVPLIQAARAAAPAVATAVSTAPSKAAVSSKPAIASPSPPSPPEFSPPQSPGVPALAGRPGPAGKLGSVRRKLPLGSGPRLESHETAGELATPRASTKLGGLGKRAGTSKSAPTSAPVSATTSHEPLVLHGTNTDAKRVRLLKDVGKWVNEGGATRKDLADLLQHQMEPSASKDLIGNLFSHDHNTVNDNVNGLTMLCDFYTDLHSGAEGLGLTEDEARAIGVANSDLALKYVSIKAHEPQSNLVSKCLDVVDAVLTFMRNVEYQLTEPEALCFIPTLVHKVRIHFG
jgi:cytoskeleton-associated protein 5